MKLKKQAFKPKVTRSAVAAAVAAALATPAVFAQEDGLKLDEIIVTAQRREQNIQDVPLSVSALSADTLSAAGVLDVSRLKLLVPGMNFGQTGAYAHVAVRGARTEAAQVNTQPIVSNYTDGIYRAGTEQFLGPMVDLNRVEVLRGPQGTLFGRNSYGGAIVFHTNRPTQEFDASIKLTGGNYSRQDFEGMINVPLSDTVSARLVGARFEHDGYVKNTVPGGADLDDQDADYIRGSLLFEFDNASLILRGEYYKQGGNGSGDFAGSLAGSLIGGDVFEVPTAVHGGSGCGSYSNVDQGLVVPNPGAVAPFSYANSTCPLPAAIANDPYKIATDGFYFLDAQQDTYSMEFNADYDWGSMKAIAAYTENKNFRGNDGDQGVSPTYLSGEVVTRETQQVEVHLVDNGEGNVSWLVGAFYLKEDSQDDFFFNSDPRGTGFQFTCITKRTVDNESTAVFGEVTVPLGERTRVTAGARYSNEANDWGINGTGGYYFSQPIPVDIRNIDIENGEFAITGDDLIVSDTFTPVTWRVALDHRLSEDTMIYGSVATGYSSGGFNSVQDPRTGRYTFDETESIAYEVGYKATLRDGTMTLNIAAFYNDYKDYIAEPAVVLPSQSVIVYDTVGGNAEAKGVDLELDWIPAENWLFNLRASYLDANYGNFITGLGGNLLTAGDRLTTFASVGTPELPAGTLVPQVRLDGLQTAFSPKYTLGLTVSYDMRLSGGSTLTPMLQSYYSDSYSASDQGYLHGQQDAYSQSSLRLTWRSEDQRFDVSGFVNNIEDEAVINRANIFGWVIATQQYAPPRTWGISFGYNYR